jgi:hypothetical protein
VEEDIRSCSRKRVDNILREGRHKIFNIYGQNSNRELPEKKYSIQGIPQKQERRKGNEIKNPRCDKEQSLDHNGLKISSHKTK